MSYVFLWTIFDIKSLTKLLLQRPTLKCCRTIASVQQLTFVRINSFAVICTVGYNEFDFFLEMKNTDPVIGAKLKSKTHLQNTFFDFLNRFLRIWLQSLQKVQI